MFLVVSNKKITIACAQECLTDEEMAEKAGIEIETIRAIRRGDNSVQQKNVGLIAKALNVKVVDILDDRFL